MKYDFKPQPASAATLWVKDWYCEHLKVNGRAPRTLAEYAEARADYQHRTRVAQVKAMAPKLALLEAFLQPLAAVGIELARREITSWESGRVLRIQPEIMTRDEKLHAALLTLGFREIERKAWGRGEAQVRLKHGRSLVVVIDVRVPVDAATPVPTESQAVPA